MKMYIEKNAIGRTESAKSQPLMADYADKYKDNQSILEEKNSLPKPIPISHSNYSKNHVKSVLQLTPEKIAQRQEDIGKQILEALKNIKMIKSGELCDFLGTHRQEFNAALSQLVKQGLVGRTDRWQYYLPTKAQNEIKNFSDYVETAQNLEKRGLWRRAADAWLRAFDATASTELRTTAVANREQCLKNIEQVRYEEEGYMSGSISESHMSGNHL